MSTSENMQSGGVANSYAGRERFWFGLLMIGAPIVMVLAGIFIPLMA